MVFPVMVLDSSFLVSLFIQEDSNNEKAIELFERHRADEMILTDIVLFETLTILAYKKGAPFAKESYHDLVSNERLQLLYLNENERKEILENFLVQEGKLSVEDISVIHSCKKAIAKPLAFDREILKRA